MATRSEPRSRSPHPEPAPLLYFDLRSGQYFMPHDGRFLQLDKSEVKLHLRRGGLSKDTFDSTGLNELERALVVAQLERYLDYSGPLGGHKPGVFTSDAGLRVLVTSGPRVPEARRGPVDAWDKFLADLLGEEQTDVLLSWLKSSRDALIEAQCAPGPMLALAGPSGCGKSFLQQLITVWLGGRVAKPYRYFSEQTAFNADLAAAEHLMIEDENASTDIRTRRKFAGHIKACVASRDFSIHGKNKDGFTLPTFRRLTLSVNEEPENLCILPPLDNSMLDKVTLLKCRPTKLGENREKTWKTFTAELPALAYMLDRWSIPHKLRSSRYGCAAWQHPELEAALTDLSPEARLLNLIDEVLFTGPDAQSGPWGPGTAEQLESELRKGQWCFAVDRLLGGHGNACGTYLGRLRRTGRITVKPLNGRNRWTIAAPQRE